MKNKRTIYRGRKMAEKLFDVYEKRIEAIRMVLITNIFGIAAIANYKKPKKTK